MKGQAAIEAVARHFSATWEKGQRDACVTIGGKRIAIEVMIAKSRIAVPHGAKPRLRFDKLALRVIHGLKAALNGAVPERAVLVLTITAPIRLGSKTVEALDHDIRAWIADGRTRKEARTAVHGNQVRYRLVHGVAKPTFKVVTFVHNPEPDPDILFGLTQTLLECTAGRRRPKSSVKKRSVRERWLAI